MGNQLFKAAKDGDLSMVQKALDRKVSLDSRDPQLRTALFIASEFGHPEIVEALISGKANVDLDNEDGETPLMIACQKGKFDCVTLLLKAGANPNAQSRLECPVIMYAGRSGKPEILTALINAGADPEGSDKSGTTALMYCALFKHKKCVAALLEASADPEKIRKDGTTAAMCAETSGSKSIQRMLRRAVRDARRARKKGAKKAPTKTKRKPMVIPRSSDPSEEEEDEEEAAETLSPVVDPPKPVMVMVKEDRLIQQSAYAPKSRPSTRYADLQRSAERGEPHTDSESDISQLSHDSLHQRRKPSRSPSSADSLGERIPSEPYTPPGSEPASPAVSDATSGGSGTLDLLTATMPKRKDGGARKKKNRAKQSPEALAEDRAVADVVEHLERSTQNLRIIEGSLNKKTSSNKLVSPAPVEPPAKVQVEPPAKVQVEPPAKVQVEPPAKVVVEEVKPNPLSKTMPSRVESPSPRESPRDKDRDRGRSSRHSRRRSREDRDRDRDRDSPRKRRDRDRKHRRTSSDNNLKRHGSGRSSRRHREEDGPPTEAWVYDPSLGMVVLVPFNEIARRAGAPPHVPGPGYITSPPGPGEKEGLASYHARQHEELAQQRLLQEQRYKQRYVTPPSPNQGMPRPKSYHPGMATGGPMFGSSRHLSTPPPPQRAQSFQVQKHSRSSGNISAEFGQPKPLDFGGVSYDPFRPSVSQSGGVFPAPPDPFARYGPPEEYPRRYPTSVGSVGANLDSVSCDSLSVPEPPSPTLDPRAFRLSMRPVGMAFVVANVNYDRFPNLPSSREDCALMARTLHGLNFRVQLFDDMPCRELAEFGHLIAGFNHSEFGAVIVYFSGHGYGEDTIIGSNAATSGVSVLQNLLRPLRQCHTLAGKPKLVLMEACCGGARVHDHIASTEPLTTSPLDPEYCSVFASEDRLLRQSSLTDAASTWTRNFCKSIQEAERLVDALQDTTRGCLKEGVRPPQVSMGLSRKVSLSVMRGEIKKRG